MSVETTALLLAWVAILLLAFALAGLLRQVRDLTAQVTGVGQGRAVSAGIQPRLAALRDWTDPGLVVFVDPGCASCADVLPELERIAREPDSPAVAVAVPRDVDGLQVGDLHVIDDAAAIFDELAVPVTPFAVVATREGAIVRGGAVGSSAALRALITTTEP